jgi:dTMP kinase
MLALWKKERRIPRWILVLKRVPVKAFIDGGFLVAVEGIDGAGKTTVATMLSQLCGERGLLCGYSKEPTSLKWGQMLRKSASEGRLTLEDEIHYFVEDRKEHVQRSIKPTLDAKGVFIVDRYYWSTAAYQGARGAEVDSIIQINEAFAPKPDLILLLDIEPAKGLDRIRKRGDIPNEFEKLEALQRSREIFLELAEKNKSNCVQVDASKTIREVHSFVLKQFQIMYLNKFSNQKIKGSIGFETLEQVVDFLGFDPKEE